MDYDSFLELVKKRRSIRRFKPDPVPDEYVDKIIEAVRWAPSGFNLQPWDFVVVNEKELKDYCRLQRPGGRSPGQESGVSSQEPVVRSRQPDHNCHPASSSRLLR
ncbi:MAG: nitroreductase family protein [Dehalococcoidia bacterium]